MGTVCGTLPLSSPHHHPSPPNYPHSHSSSSPSRKDDTKADADIPAPDEEIDIDLNDPEVNAAATKIQASFKGHKARKEVQALKVCWS